VLLVGAASFVVLAPPFGPWREEAPLAHATRQDRASPCILAEELAQRIHRARAGNACSQLVSFAEKDQARATVDALGASGDALSTDFAVSSRHARSLRSGRGLGQLMRGYMVPSIRENRRTGTLRRL
jgi:hypothetical protein